MLDEKLGTLYVVATPIGNLQDISFRAIEILNGVDKIAAEDTRHSKMLLNHFGITKPTLSLHNFNEKERVQKLIQLLQAGESIALISDAGTPLISDPGYHLVKHARDLGINVIPAPGPCALITALCASGLATDRFVFEGFLPAKKEARSVLLENFQFENRTMIFYEAPHRLLDSLNTIQEVFGAKRIVTVARELTKMHESIMTDEIASILDHYSSHPDQVRGEVVLLIKGLEKEALADKNRLEAEDILRKLLNDLPLKQAVAITVKLTNARKNELYNYALSLQKPLS